MLNRAKVKKAQVRRAVEATFPNYKGRRFFCTPVAADASVHAQLYWDEGVRDYAALWNPLTGEVRSFGTLSPFHPTTHEPVKVPDGWALVKLTSFRGQEWVNVHATPTTLPHLGDPLLALLEPN